MDHSLIRLREPSIRPDVKMPVLDAKALETDPKGMEFLRDVLRGGTSRRPADAPTYPPRKGHWRTETASVTRHAPTRP
jgi:hypothetical protein